MEEKKQNKKALVVAIALVLLLLVTGTYAWMMLTKNSSVVNKITAGNLELRLDESSSDGIHLEKQVPMSLNQGLTTTPYTFKIVNNGDTAASYTINLEDFYDDVTIPEEGKLEDSKIRYLIAKDGVIPTIGSGDTKFYAYSGETLLFTAAYNKEINQITSLIQNYNNSENEGFREHMNSQIASTGSTTEDGAYEVFKNAVGTSYTFKKENSSKRVSHLLSEGRGIETGVIEGNSEVSYTLYMWIDSRAGIEVNGQIFSGRLNITASQSVQAYKVSGVLTDGTEQIVANATLLGFTQSGTQVVATTDTEGKFSMDNLPAGENKIYYVPTGLDISNKTKEEIDAMTGVASTTITAPTDSERAVMTNNYIINDIIISKIKKKTVSNSNVLAAYTYVAPTNIVKEGNTVTSYQGCVSGEEVSCAPTKCYEDSEEGSCPAGTIIKYKVNDSTVKYFYVLHDDGETLTLQQRENTTGLTSWYGVTDGYSEADATKGPLNAIQTLESATSDWTNVNNLTYTAGTTEFGPGSSKSKFTKCTSPDLSNTLTCSENLYTWESRTAKARMITIPELMELQCKYETVSSDTCPVFIKNGLADSVSYGGTFNNMDSYGYWTMNGANETTVYRINYAGAINDFGPLYSQNVTRAVVEINK